MSKSKGTDIVTIALLGALGVGGFLIYKNKDAIGDFFGGIGKGVDDTIKDVQKGVDDTIKGGQELVEKSTPVQTFNLLSTLFKGVPKMLDKIGTGITEKVDSGVSSVSKVVQQSTPVQIGSLLSNLVSGITAKKDPTPTTSEPKIKPSTLELLNSNGYTLQDGKVVKIKNSTPTPTPITEKPKSQSNPASVVYQAFSSVAKGIGDVLQTGISLFKKK